ncbi:MAG: hypothetical protein FJ119_11785 [Deltaproteobacteria bacterium]|nr:hypothetical protein [Deltaproteobacteria bacterium]
MPFTHSPAAETSSKLYDVIFSISIDGNGKLKAFKVNQVFDRESETRTPITMEVSTEFIKNVRRNILNKEHESDLDNGVPKEFYRKFLYDPQRPSIIDIEPEAE